VEALKKTNAIAPGFIPPHWSLAQVFHWQGKYVEALAELDPLAAKLPKGLSDTLIIRGDLNRTMGRLDAAAADYQRLLQLNPKQTQAYFNLAWLYDKKGKHAEALTFLERMVAADPGVGTYLCRAEFLRDHGDFDKALTDCTAAAKKTPASLLPGLVQAGIMASRGDYRHAVKDAETILAKMTIDDGQVLYKAACVWSLAAAAAMREGAKAEELARQYAERSAALLERALDSGFHDLVFPEHNRMVDDPALEAARQQPRVRELLRRGR